jgi:hypothetical protein
MQTSVALGGLFLVGGILYLKSQKGQNIPTSQTVKLDGVSSLPGTTNRDLNDTEQVWVGADGPINPTTKNPPKTMWGFPNPFELPKNMKSPGTGINTDKLPAEESDAWNFIVNSMNGKVKQDATKWNLSWDIVKRNPDHAKIFNTYLTSEFVPKEFIPRPSGPADINYDALNPAHNPNLGFLGGNIPQFLIQTVVDQLSPVQTSLITWKNAPRAKVT